ncbi:hypothetical protein DANDELION_71 [Mycobacterium phage Dandelion]|uniref:Uncharacterized protein n=1 Tax=Mycobacterium phage Dandelion TaxID=1074305 RepID=G1JW23_9CAUD|nr:hypothetical protein DANDELION_71 [Mycobacterium phage Dandelion]AEL97741.1 hypothetical protein DANDELION_71 [Mycobacterium phage Dandelion]AXQ61468.1 hypothetical protein SEA_MEGAMIND_66 [Mycobacterium phage Megamind]
MDERRVKQTGLVPMGTGECARTGETRERNRLARCSLGLSMSAPTTTTHRKEGRMAHNDLVKLASDLNEKAFSVREDLEHRVGDVPADLLALLAAVDALTGAVVELAATDDVATELEELKAKFDRVRTCR